MIDIQTAAATALLTAPVAMWLGQRWALPLSRPPESLGLASLESLEDANAGELFQVLFDNAPECVKLQSREGRITLINAAGMKLLETKDEKAAHNLSVYEVVSPSYHQAYKALTERVFAGHSAFLEFELISLCGNKRWLETHAVPLKSPSGSVTKLLAITRDITDRKAILKKLEEQKNRLKIIINSEPECVKLQDASGIIHEMNPAGVALLNAESDQQVVGKSVYEFILPEYQERYQTLTRRVFSGEQQTMEFEVCGLGGKQRWLETHATPLFDASGKVAMLLAITRDIDKRKKTEFKLQQKQSELAHVCRISTMGSLASSLAHELNQPLCAISSYAQSAQELDGQHNEKLSPILEKIVAQAERANQVIARLRDFVREQEPRRSPQDIIQMVTESIEFLEHRLRRQGIRIIAKSQPALPKVMADRIQVEQVLLNLLSNASQALRQHPETPAVIRIAIDRDSAQELRVSVSNGGPPIDDDVKQKLFTPFYTTRENGLGMGLVISRSIIEAHGGRLWHDTPISGGACFRFTLPIECDER